MDQPFYTYTTDLQLRSVAKLLEAAERSTATLQESQFRDRYAVDASYAASRLLEILRFRGSYQFFDVRYYNAVQLGLRKRNALSKKRPTSLNLAFFHNDSIEAFEAFEASEGEVSELPLGEAQREDFRRFGFLLGRLKDGNKPFGHPFIGAAIPLAAAETILRFALRQPASTELADVFPEDKAEMATDVMGLRIVLYQCRYFDLDPNGKVFNKRDQSLDT